MNLVMISRFRLFHKLLILVMVPLLVECAFISVLFKMLSDAEAEIKQEQKARQIVTHLNTILRLIMAGAAGVRISYPGVQAHEMLEYRQREEFSKLKLLVADDPRTLKKVKDMERMWAKSLKNFRAVRDMAMDGDAVNIYKNVQSMKDIYKDTYYQISKAIEEAESLERKAPLKSEKIREQMRLYLLLGLLMNIVVAGGLTWYLNKVTARRLSVLMDNTERIADGEELHPPVGGSDEISELDEFITEMVANLKRSADNEHEALERIKQTEFRVRKMLESIPSGVIVAAKDGKIEYVNPLMAELIGIPQLRFDNEHVASFIKLPDGAIGNRLEFFQTLQKLEDEQADDQWSSTKTTAVRNNGEEFPVEVIVREIDWTEGSRYMVALADITEREKLESMKKDFIGMVTHDVRSPLNALLAFLELLEDNVYGTLNQDGIRKLKMAEANIDMVVRLISDLLDLDKIEAGLLDLEIKSVESKSPAERAVNSVKNLAERKNVKISESIEDCTMNVDEDRLVQVLVNLMSNAIKYSPQDGEVKLEIKLERPWVRVEVTDQGPGIPEEEKKKVFDRFTQLKDRSRKGGSGLGLAISKALVEQHGGTIGVKGNNEKPGSTFWFILPA